MNLLRKAIFFAVAFSLQQPAFSTAADTPSNTNTLSVDSNVTDADLAGNVCSITEEKFLPSDYFYCLASAAYGSHRYEAAQKHFRTAASWGSKAAQYVLGVMALNGDQQPVDRPLALAWFSLAAERHQADFQAVQQQLAANLTPAERQTADDLLQKMRSDFGDAVAAERAERRYRESMQLLTRRGDRKDFCFSGIVRGGGFSASGSNSSILCVPIPKLTETLDQVASREFEGWAGHVTVGPIQPQETKASR